MHSYYLSIVGGDETDAQTFALVNGDVDEIAYGLKRARKRMDATDLEEFSVRFVQTDGIGGDETGKPTVLTADAETILTVLNKKIRAERKNARGNEGEGDEQEDAEPNDVLAEAPEDVLV